MVKYKSNKYRGKPKERIYLVFKQGTRIDLDLEEHYEPLILNIGISQTLKSKINNHLSLKVSLQR